MRLIKLSVLGLLISTITINQSFADILVYQCKMKNGHMNFTDQPCKKDEKEKSRKIIKNLAMTHSVKPKPIADDSVAKKNAPQNTETVYPTEERRVVRQHREWDLGYPEPIVVLPYPPSTWPNTYSAQPPLFNPPLSFNPPLTVQPPSR